MLLLPPPRLSRTAAFNRQKIPLTRENAWENTYPRIRLAAIWSGAVPRAVFDICIMPTVAWVLSRSAILVYLVLVAV
jgi:hypothetical protein